MPNRVHKSKLSGPIQAANTIDLLVDDVLSTIRTENANKSVELVSITTTVSSQWLVVTVLADVSDEETPPSPSGRSSSMLTLGV